MTGLPMVRCEKPIQSGPSQGYLIANAHQTRYPPGGPDHIFDLSAHPCVAVSAGTRALLSPPAPADLQLAVGIAPHLWRTGQPESASPARPWSSGVSPVSAPAL